MPWPLSEATPALFFVQQPGHILQAKLFSIPYFLTSLLPYLLTSLLPLLLSDHPSRALYPGLSAFSPISLARKRRPKLSCREPRQRTEAPAEFPCAQTPLPTFKRSNAPACLSPTGILLPQYQDKVDTYSQPAYSGEIALMRGS